MANHTALRIYLLETDKHDGVPVYQAVINYLHKHDYAGATVLRGLESFGSRTHRIHNAGILDLSANLPVVVEVIDTNERIATLKASLKDSGVLGSRMITEPHRPATVRSM